MPLNRPEFAQFARVRMPRPLQPDEEHLAPVRDHIERFGWHVQQVMAGPGRLAWTYTIGFGDTFGEPDLVVCGLPYAVAGQLLNDLGDALASGRRWADGERISGFLEGVDVELRMTLERWSPAHFGRARDWYGEYPAVRQMAVPDLENRFPGEEGCEAEQSQLLLWSESPAPRPLTHPHTPIEVEEASVVDVDDLLDGKPTGWTEEVVVVAGTSPDRRVVVSVPYVDHVAFGDELDEAGVVTQYAPVATVRLCVLQGGDDTRARVEEFLADVERNEVVWESPVRPWFFLAVPHHWYGWFLDLVSPLLADRTVSMQTARAPATPG